MTPRGRRPLNEAERALWDEFTRKIERLRDRPIAEVQDDIELAVAALTPQKLKKPAPLPPKVAPKSPAPAPSITPLDRRMKKRVARGKIEIDGKLDLHGHTQDEAHGALLRFLRSSSAREKKLVLVITGKSGVLRRQTPLWLALPEFSAYVIGYETAAISHGGEGALYVRIRRAR